jgi:hypothetical protein
VITNIFDEPTGRPAAVDPDDAVLWLNRAYRSHTMPIQPEAYKMAQTGMAFRPNWPPPPSWGPPAFWANITTITSTARPRCFVGRHWGGALHPAGPWINAPSP